MNIGDTVLYRGLPATIIGRTRKASPRYDLMQNGEIVNCVKDENDRVVQYGIPEAELQPVEVVA